MALTNKLKDIADAIREKTGSTELLTLVAMPIAIENIDTGETNKLPGFLAYYKNGSEKWFDSITPEDLAGLTCVRPYGFAGWNGDSIAFPDGVVFTVYGGYQFLECSHLSSVTLPSDLTSISENMFKGCAALKQITLPSTITHIYQHAFSGAGLNSIEIPASCKQIDSLAFYNCDGLQSVIFEGKPDSIATNVFNGCDSTLNIYVPWSEGEVANAPWSTTTNHKITVHYNSQGGNT